MSSQVRSTKSMAKWCPWKPTTPNRFDLRGASLQLGFPQIQYGFSTLASQKPVAIISSRLAASALLDCTHAIRT